LPGTFTTENQATRFDNGPTCLSRCVDLYGMDASRIEQNKT